MKIGLLYCFSVCLGMLKVEADNGEAGRRKRNINTSDVMSRKN